MSSRWLLPNVLSKCWQLFARFRLPDESLLKFCNFQLPDEELGAPVPPRGLKLHRQRGELAEGVEGAELRAPRVGPEPPEDSTTEPLFLRRLYSVVVEKRVTTRKKRMRLRRKYFVERVLSQNVWVMKVEDTTTSILNHARTSTSTIAFFC